MKYAVNLDPAIPVPGGRGVVAFNYTHGALDLTFLRAHTDVTYTVEGSHDLTSWIPTATNSGAVGQFVTVYDTVHDKSSRFLRLRVSLQ